MEASTMSSTGMPSENTFNQWARQQEPELEILSSSTPEPRFMTNNLVARFHRSDVARRVVLEWERIEPAEGAVGMVVMGHPVDHTKATEESSADPEGVTGHAANRIVKGGVPGAVIGAIVVAALMLIVDGWSGTVIGLAIGGAAFGFVAGAVFSYVKGTGWGTAYEHSFADKDALQVIYASIHSEDAEQIERAIEAAAGYEDVALSRVDASGQRSDVTARS
jgi:hypothetical protein